MAAGAQRVHPGLAGGRDTADRRRRAPLGDARAVSNRGNACWVACWARGSSRTSSTARRDSSVRSWRPCWRRSGGGAVRCRAGVVIGLPVFTLAWDRARQHRRDVHHREGAAARGAPGHGVSRHAGGRLLLLDGAAVRACPALVSTFGSGRSCADERPRCGGRGIAADDPKRRRRIGKAARPVHDATVAGRIAAHRRGKIDGRRNASHPFSLPLAMNQPESFVTLAASVGAPAYVRHPRLLGWVREIAALAQPERSCGAMAATPNIEDCARRWSPRER